MLVLKKVLSIKYSNYSATLNNRSLGLDYFICHISQAEPNDKPVYVYVRGTFDSDTKFLEFFGQFQLIAFGHKPVVLKALFYEQLALQTNPYLPSSSPEYNIQQNMWGDIRFGLASTRIRDKYLHTKNLLALKLSQRSQNIIVEISYKFDVTIGHPDPRAFPSLLENHATYLARICKELTPKTFGSPRHFWLNINVSLSFADAKLITHLDVDFMRMDLVDFSINSPVFSTLYTSRIRINQLNILAHIDPSLPISFAPLRLAHQLQIDIHDHPMQIITGSGIHVKVCSIGKVFTPLSGNEHPVLLHFTENIHFCPGCATQMVIGRDFLILGLVSLPNAASALQIPSPHLQTFSSMSPSTAQNTQMYRFNEKRNSL
ncbi:hypothetical protein DdX_17433 [Ditylenchus destructor]|uniref:Uncharacterized protein n=1 Tax=Ditylenchus destructor TaxID=166010 RepID=A0AAD4MMK3_9BILA|nr:hypothetical protein DdX_17433 [Ditylenchus destructor]